MGSGLSLLLILAIVVTIAEVLVAYFLIKKHNMKIWQSLYTSLPVIVIVWVVAIMYS
ncbi:hypothetical protein SAMN05216232_3044 [Virgibacillus subterraneus]|uniref:Uncharacterized protein n=2 Tax=Virgibacillus TaxID=84406 RepID=A0A1H1FH56_9BACI|nr:MULTISPECIES: hypothetical protein [Virgibacillus]SDR00281.1 hypothetical protein SAMN05216231_3207 [Virgibacillus salinus]SEQ69927.1 hypothetical protein SAMN05216232_3044 [Virgibacillus subterraneus]